MYVAIPVGTTQVQYNAPSLCFAVCTPSLMLPVNAIISKTHMYHESPALAISPAKEHLTGTISVSTPQCFSYWLRIEQSTPYDWHCSSVTQPLCKAKFKTSVALSNGSFFVLVFKRRRNSMKSALLVSCFSTSAFSLSYLYIAPSSSQFKRYQIHKTLVYGVNSCHVWPLFLWRDASVCHFFFSSLCSPVKR
jgi:hypothetical protein